MNCRDDNAPLRVSAASQYLYALSLILALACLMTLFSAHAGAIHTLTRTNTEPVTAMAFSPDGKILAVGSSAPAASSNADNWDMRLPEGTIELWNLDTGKLARTLRQSARTENGDTANRVTSLAFSPKGDSLIGTDMVGHILWNLETGEAQTQWHDMFLSGDCSPAWSPDGRLIALPWMEGIAGPRRPPGVAIVEAISGKELRFIPVRESGYVRSARISPDGKLLATAGHDCEVRVFNLSDGEEVLSDRTGGTLFAACFSHDGRQLVAGSSWAGVLLLYEVDTTHDPMQVAKNGTSARTGEEIHFVEFTADGQKALSVSHRGIRIWDIRNWQESKQLLNCTARLSPDGNRVALVRDQKPRSIEIWSLQDLPLQDPPTLK